MYAKFERSMCPGDTLRLEYRLLGDHVTNNDWFALYKSDFKSPVDDQIDFRYFYSQTEFIDNTWTQG